MSTIQSSESSFKQPSVMTTQQHFSQIPSADIPRSRFDRSHAYKTTMDASWLVPTYVDEVLPGDTFTMTQTAFARLATPLKPIMDNLYLDTQFFFVPYRLVWDNWQKFMGERVNPADDPSIYTIPQTAVSRQSATEQLIWRYMGIPHDPNATVATNVSALPFRAYHLIYNEWYRDQNLIDSFDVPKGDGPDNGLPDYHVLHKRGKRHDYFTSCLPWPQKGDAVTIPIGDSAPVSGIGVVTTATPGVTSATFTRSDGSTFTPSAGDPAMAASQAGAVALEVTGTSAPVTPEIFADLASATSITINELRTAFQIQKLLERDARGGTRYIELILSHFGVRSPDARLQRPEYLGGGSTRVNINPVAATATDPSIPQGNLAATGTAVSRAGFKKSFTEHGIIIGISSVRADLTYQKGIERFWSRSTRYDFYWPTLSHLGEQAVLNKEIYASTDGSTDDDVFGYQERYAEYRYKPSLITGKFASNDAASLDVWHLSQDFASLPTLGETFITEDVPIERIVAVSTEPDFLVDFYYELKCDRPMPVYSVPGLIDHF